MIQDFLFTLHQWLVNVSDIFVWSAVVGGSSDAICNCLTSLAETKQLEIGLFSEGGWSPEHFDPLDPNLFHKNEKFTWSTVEWSPTGTFRLNCCYNQNIQFTLIGLRDLPTVSKMYAFDGNRVLNLKSWSRVVLATFPFWITRTAPTKLTRDRLRCRKRKQGMKRLDESEQSGQSDQQKTQLNVDDDKQDHKKYKQDIIDPIDSGDHP